jgi:hypothetical protein
MNSSMALPLSRPEGFQHRRGFPERRLRGAGELRRHAEVQREIAALVLEHQPLVPRGELADACRGAAQVRRRQAVAMHGAGGVAPLDAVLAGRRQRERREQSVDVGDRAAADQGEGATGGALQALEQPPLGAARAHRVGTLGVVEQRAVDVEEQRPVGAERRRGIGRRAQGAAAPRRGAWACAITRRRCRMRAASSSMRPAQR